MRLSPAAPSDSSAILVEFSSGWSVSLSGSLTLMEWVPVEEDQFEGLLLGDDPVDAHRGDGVEAVVESLDRVACGGIAIEIDGGLSDAVVGEEQQQTVAGVPPWSPRAPGFLQQGAGASMKACAITWLGEGDLRQRP
ncbi:hypothetical protein [Micromonospora sp. KC723]|uniref:hypothetical protein n=1 Tax=Micromonospora sp. KC723 TaxID=2530381 RepID=UPI001A9F6CB9|nr:hypothetical protein [Micromonospora sp. KC723]